MKTKEKNGNNVSHSFWRFAKGAAGGTLRRMVWLALLAGLLASVTSARSGVPGVGGKRDMDAMQVNLYVGGDLSRAVVLDPTDPDYFTKLIQAVTGIYYEINLSQPPVRLQGVADEIAARMPDLVSVEAVSYTHLTLPTIYSV